MRMQFEDWRILSIYDIRVVHMTYILLSLLRALNNVECFCAVCWQNCWKRPENFQQSLFVVTTIHTSQYRLHLNTAKQGEVCNILCIGSSSIAARTCQSSVHSKRFDTDLLFLTFCSTIVCKTSQ